MMKLLSKVINFRISIAETTISRFLEPVTLHAKEISTVPTLKLKPQKYLMKNWWSEKPFDVQGAMTVPVFSFQTGKFANRSVDLPQDIFNHPLRRDLMYRLYDFRINLNKFTTKVTRNRAMTSGSGKKMRNQKKTGSARQGDKRAPHLKKGGKAHGAKAKIFSYHLNAKIKLAGLKSLLSAKMAQGKIKIINSQILSQAKTKILGRILQNYSTDNRTLFCIITSQDIDPNFALAHQNIQRIIHHTPYSLDILTLFKVDKILITEQGLQALIENIYKTSYVAFRQPHMKNIKDGEENAKQQNLDPEKPYEFKFRILAEYMEIYNKIKTQTPQLLQLENKKVRRLDL